MKRSVNDLINQKGLRFFPTVSPDAQLIEALVVLEQTRSGAVLVTKNNQLCGIFSEKDFAKASIYHAVDLSSKVQLAMTSKVYYVEPSFNLEECLYVMSKVHIRHLPVLDKGKPIALISMRHIVEVLIQDKENQIRDLTTYITGFGSVAHLRSEKEIPIYSTL